MDTQAALEEVQELIDERAYEDALAKLELIKVELESRMEKGDQA